MKRWLSEPLVGFTVIALLLLALDALLRPSAEVEVGPGLSDAVDRAFEAQHGRSPTPAEHDAAVQAWIDDELLYREGLELGLHEGDPVIRRRVIQQLRQLHRARAGDAPTDAELLALRDAWPERYSLPERLAFEHHFFAERKEEAEAQVAALVAGKRTRPAGQAFARGTQEALSPVEGLSRAYGISFVRTLLDTDQWVALQSRYGWHVARRTGHAQARVPELDEIRPVLLRDWQTDAADRAEADALDRLRGAP